MRKGKKSKPGLTRKERQAVARLDRRVPLTPESIKEAQDRTNRMLASALGTMRRTRSYP